MDKDKKLYEIAYLISPAYSEEEALDFQQSIKNHMQSLDGIIDHEGEVIKRRISYPINKMTEAFLASFRFLLESEKLAEFKSKLNAPQVLRSLVINTKRQPARTYRPRVEKISEPERIIEFGSTLVKPVELKQVVEQPAANIEEIDKRLEEILGK